MNPSLTPNSSHGGAWSFERAVETTRVTTHAARAEQPILRWARDLLVHESPWDVIDRERAPCRPGVRHPRTSPPGMTRETALVEIEAACALSRYLCQGTADAEIGDAVRVFAQQRSALEASLRDDPKGRCQVASWRVDELCRAWQKLSAAGRTRFELTGPLKEPHHPIDRRLQLFNAIVWSMGRTPDPIGGASATKRLADLQRACDAFHGSHRLPPDQAERQCAMALEKSREVIDAWVAARKTASIRSTSSSSTAATTPPSASLPALLPTPRTSQRPSLPPDRRTHDQIYLPPILRGTGASSMSRAAPPVSLIDGVTISLDQLLGLPEEILEPAEPSATPDALSRCLGGQLPAGRMPRIAFELPSHGGQRYADARDFLGDLQVVHRYLGDPSVREHACGRTLAMLTDKVCQAVEIGHAPPVTALAGLLDTARRASVCVDARQALTPIAAQIEEYASRGAAELQRDAGIFHSKLRELDACMNEADGAAAVLARHGRFTVEEQWRTIENRIEQLVRAGAAMLRNEGGTALAREGQWKTGSPDSPSSTRI